MSQLALPEALLTAPTALQSRYAGLAASLGRFQRLLVAYSGGVDSAFLLDVAVRHLGRSRVQAVLADSPSLPRRELAEAVALAERIGADLRVVATHELEDLKRRQVV